MQFVIVALAVIGTNTACLVRTRKPDAKVAIGQTARLSDLTTKVDRFGTIQTLRANVQLQLSFVEQDQDTVKEFSNVTGFILIQRPGNIRVRAQVPVVRTTALEMASAGATFQVHVPSKSRFLVGDTAANKPSESRVENVRPQHILEAVLISPQRDDEKPLLENVVEGLKAYQLLVLVRPGAEEGQLQLSRKIWFDRSNLEITRQEIYDDKGDVATDAWYREWSTEGTVMFPHFIYMSRPGDGYDLQVRILKVDLNVPLPADAFDLKPPEGTKIERIGEMKESAASGGVRP